MLLQFVHLSRFAHGMPLVADAAGCQYQWISIIRLFTFIFIRERMNDGSFDSACKISYR